MSVGVSIFTGAGGEPEQDAEPQSVSLAITELVPSDRRCESCHFRTPACQRKSTGQGVCSEKKHQNRWPHHEVRWAGPYHIRGRKGEVPKHLVEISTSTFTAITFCLDNLGRRKEEGCHAHVDVEIAILVSWGIITTVNIPATSLILPQLRQYTFKYTPIGTRKCRRFIREIYSVWLAGWAC